MIQRVFTLGLLVFLSLGVKAQDQTIDQTLIWLGAELRVELNEQQYFNLKVEERRFAFPDGRQQRVLPDLRYGWRFRDSWTWETGLWFFEINEPQDPFEVSLGQVKEFRPYINLSKTWPGPSNHYWSFRLQSEYRLFRTREARHQLRGPILREDIRERFKLAFHWQINSLQKLVFYEELHLVAYSTEAFQWFHQNRLGLKYQVKIGPGFTLSAGYLHWFQPTSKTALYFSRQIATLSLRYRFRL